MEKEIIQLSGPEGNIFFIFAKLKEIQYRLDKDHPAKNIDPIEKYTKSGMRYNQILDQILIDFDGYIEFI